MSFEAMRLVVFSVCFFVIGYIVGHLKTLWNLRKLFPDLYEDLKRRVFDDNA